MLHFFKNKKKYYDSLNFYKAHYADVTEDKAIRLAYWNFTGDGKCPILALLLDKVLVLDKICEWKKTKKIVDSID
jgi:hypothetical protein